MNPFRFTIASLLVAVAVVALDTVWIKHLLTTHRSALGFAVEGADCGLFLMANVLPFGLCAILSGRGDRRFFLGFVVGGLAAALAFASCTWLAPDAVRTVAGAALDPVWNLLLGWVPNGTIGGLVAMMLFLAAGLGAPQLLIASACGIQARRVFRRYHPDGPRPGDEAPTGIAPGGGDRTASERSLVPSGRVVVAV